MSRLLLAIAFAALVVAGCGGDDGDGRSPEDLARMLPAPSFPGLSTIDLAAAREALDLPADADPLDGRDDKHKRLLAAGGAAVNLLARPDRPAIVEAVDFGAVTAAAATTTSVGPGSGAVLATRQAADDIRAGLKRAGYSETDGAFLTEELGPRAGYKSAAVGDGVIALAGDAETARAILERDEPAAGIEDLIDTLDLVDGAARVAVKPREGCIEAVAGSDPIDEDSGELAVRVRDGDAQADAIAPGGDDAPYAPLFAIEDRKADGDVARARIKPKRAAPYISPAVLLAGDLQASDIYRC